MLNDYFTSIFTTEDSTNIPVVPESGYSFMDPISGLVVGIAKLIENLKLTPSAGIDEINSKLLKIP